MTSNRTDRSIPALALAVLVVAAVACAPAQAPSQEADAEPEVSAVVLNAPFPERVPGAAEGLQERLSDRDTGVALTGAALGRFLESRRGLVGGGAHTAAAGVARTVDADFAVGISASTLERELLGGGTRPLERVTLRLEAFIVTADGELRARLSSGRHRDAQRLDESELPALDEDRLLADLRDDALDELTPRLAQALRDAAGTPAEGSGGAGILIRSSDE